MEDTLILAIESSCDETAASVVKNGRTILSNVISSQIELHKLYGGVVPEIASRKHIEKVNQVIEEALERMNLSDHRDQVIMVGDREHDILGARRCGIQCVAVSYGYGSREELEAAQPLQIVASADELLNFFD